MAKVTIKITDEVLAEESFKVDFVAEGAEIDEGQATAAYFTAYYLQTLISEEGFLADATEYGREVISDKQIAGLPLPTMPATMRLVLTDEDINIGHYTAELIMDDGDITGKSQPTTAQVLGLYMRRLVSSEHFALECWQFARRFIADRDDAYIANDHLCTVIGEKDA